MLHPEALWALTLAIPITVVFLYRGKKRRVAVSSLAIWREALGREGRPRGFTRLREWLLLAVNLGLLALLTGAATAPGEKGGQTRAEHWAFVVDVSPSMAADAGGRTRLEAARAELRSLLARLPPTAWVTLATAGAEPVYHGPAPAGSDEPPAWIDALVWRPGPCRPAEAWRGLRVHPDASALHVVFLSDGAGIAGLEEFLRDPRHFFLRLGDPGPNAAIVGAAVDRSWGDSTAEVQLELRAAADAALRREWIAALDGRELGRGAVEIAPGTATLLTVAVPTYMAGLLEVRLTPADAMPLDDHAFLAFAPLVRPWVWVVAEGEGGFVPQVLAALEEHVDRAASARVSPRDFRPAQLPDKGVGLVVFDGVDPPAGLPAGNYLYFGSGGDFLPARVGPVTESPAVARWAADHPLLRRAPLDLLQVRRSRRVFPGRADRALLETADGALAFAGTEGGRAHVYFGFRLEDSNLPVLVAFPLLMKNVISWFAGKRTWLFRPQYRCGATVTLEAADIEVEVVRLRRIGGGAEGLVPAVGRELVLAEPLPPGAYAAEAGGAKGAFGVNLFDPGEVDVRPTSTPARPPPLAAARPAEEGSPPWVRLVLWALAALCLEWMLFHATRG